MKQNGILIETLFGLHYWVVQAVEHRDDISSLHMRILILAPLRHLEKIMQHFRLIGAKTGFRTNGTFTQMGLHRWQQFLGETKILLIRVLLAIS